MRWYRKPTKALKQFTAFAGGFILGQVYYYYLLKEIPFPGYMGRIVCLVISVTLGLGNAISKQLRCISVLIFAMYCDKPGRGVLKAVILTYIVTGPITNMGLNAKEVVRVFACSTQLSYNLSREKYELMLGPSRDAALGVRVEVEAIKDAFRSIKDIAEPLQQEIEGTNETQHICFENDLIDDLFDHPHRTEDIEMKFETPINSNSCSLHYTSLYRMKLQCRCENHLSRASAVCIQEFTKAYLTCCELLPEYDKHVFCWPLKKREICDIVSDLSRHRSENEDICEPPIGPGFGHGFSALKYVASEYTDKLSNVHLQYRVVYEKELLDIRDATETAVRVQHAFDEKIILMHHVSTVMNLCLALLFLRLFNAAVAYHDLYLTNIDYDNVYITGYFKRLDARRNLGRRLTLLPLKKMERNKYIDVYSLSYKDSQRDNLIMQILKVLLEVVTATTFVMLDRLFFEALDVVRQHAETDVLQQGTRDLNIEVEGTGVLATMLRKFLDGLINNSNSNRRMSNFVCLPHPRQMPYVYFFKIYGGYTWIVLLLFANPYTLRLKRLICMFFYPLREKQRILHLYNDILKKRMKMHKTLRRKAVQAVRAHYLSGEILSLRSVRMRFPQLFGWLRVLPAARMTCLICGETEPRRHIQSTRNRWYSCHTAKCPFVYCGECWREAGARCLACEPGLAELSDVDSLTDDETLKY